MKINNYLIIILTLLFTNSCAYLDEETSYFVVCSRGLKAGEAFTLWCHGGSIEAENGLNAGFRITSKALVALGGETSVAQPVTGSMRWTGSKPSEFYASTAPSVPVDAKKGIYGPAEIPSRQRWEQIYNPVPMLAGPMMTERDLPLVMPFSRAVSVVTLALPPLAAGVEVKGAEVSSMTEAVSGQYTVEYMARKVSACGRSEDTGRIVMDLQDAEPSSDGWTYIRFLLVPHRYNDLSYCVTLVKDGVEHTFTALLMDEPHSHTLTPFCGMMACVSLPAPMTKTYNE